MLGFRKWLEAELPTTVARRSKEENPTTWRAAQDVKNVIDQIDASRSSRIRPTAGLYGSPAYMSPEQARGNIEILPDLVERFLRKVYIMLPVKEQQISQLIKKWRDFRNSLYQKREFIEAKLHPTVANWIPHKTDIDDHYLTLKRLKRLLPQMYEPLQEYDPKLFKQFADFYNDFESSQEIFDQAVELQKRALGGEYKPAGPITGLAG